MRGKSAESPQATSLCLSPARWKTREFYFYYVAFSIVVPYMFYVTCNLSQESSPHYQEYASLLSEGWIFGRKVDNSDAQYAEFRDNIPKLVPLAIVYLGLSHLFRALVQEPRQRAFFSLGASLVVIAGLHGTSIIKIATIVSASYFIGRCTGGSKWNPALTWLFNLFILFQNEWNNGYRFASLSSSLTWMDHHQGALPRWHILFNFVMLRLISFNMDFYWQVNKPQVEYTKKEDTHQDALLSDKGRTSTPRQAADYNYVFFLTYVFYTPLYLCGPILTFNDFVSQLRSPSRHLTTRFIVTYAARFAAVLLVMEFTLHYMYVVAISKSKAWAGDSPLELSMIGYFNLVIIWMKLLIPWRFFRLWALADGIWTEENMVRCMSNNFSAQRFWKSWHRSFNRWTIRYIFIPLGGSKYFKYNMWVIFTFVALWHDIELKLLAWGWLICLFLLPELVASSLFSFKKFGHKPYYRFVCGVGAVGNILMMMIANLVGFCVGVDGMVEMLTQIFGTAHGLVFFLSVSICIFIAVQVMFEIREEEKRRGDPKWKM